MKKLRLFKTGFTALFSVLIAVVTMTTNVFANNVDPLDLFIIEHQNSPNIDETIRVEKDGDKYRIVNSSSDVRLMGYVYHQGDPIIHGAVTKVHSPINNIVLKVGSEIIFSDNSSYVILDATDSWRGEEVVIITENESYTWFIMENGPEVYFEGQIDLRPVISGQENFVTSVDSPITVNEIQNYLTAWDETDGDLTDEIYIVTDNYTPNKLVLGKHSIVFGVEDTAGNEATVEVFVNVVDITDPVITGNSTKAQISYTQTWNINSFKSTLVATDNYDTLTNADIYIVSDNYTNNKTKLGTYSIVFGVEDASGNETTFTKQVEVIDDVAPIINGPTTLTKPSNGTLTINEILAQLTATDEKEGNVTSSLKVITDNYTGKGNIVGSYTIVFEAEDSKGNAATHTVTVQVIDNIAPIFYIKDGVSIVLSPGVELTRQQIIDLLIASEQLPVGGTTTFSFPIDEYSGNSDTPGVYAMQVLAKSTNGNEYSHTFGITVMEDEEGGIIVDEPIDWFGWWDDTVEWVEENPYTTGGIGIGVLALIGLLIYASKRKPKNKRRRRK